MARSSPTAVSAREVVTPPAADTIAALLVRTPVLASRSKSVLLPELPVVVNVKVPRLSVLKASLNVDDHTLVSITTDVPSNAISSFCVFADETADVPLPTTKVSAFSTACALILAASPAFSELIATRMVSALVLPARIV